MNQDDRNAIDFPCSYTWRAYYEETFYNRYLPSIELPSTEEPIIEPSLERPKIIVKHHYISPKTYQQREKSIEVHNREDITDRLYR